MKVEQRTAGGVIILELSGALDTRNAREVQMQLLSAIPPGGRAIFELSGVTHLSSAGLRALLSLYRYAASQGGALVLVGVSEELRDTMEITGFWGFFSACASLEEALAALAERVRA